MATTKISIRDLDIAMLVKYETAAKMICQRYENTVKNYDGSIDNNSSDYKAFSKYNNIRTALLNEIERKLSDLTV